MKVTYIEISPGEHRVLKAKKHALLISQIQGYKAGLLAETINGELNNDQWAKLKKFTNEICKKS